MVFGIILDLAFGFAGIPKQLSATDVSNALSLQNLIVPAGTAKVGRREYLVRVNSSPLSVDELNDLPIKTVNGATINIGDVAHVTLDKLL
jgi:multidrug efflux pump subunit AcrB